MIQADHKILVGGTFTSLKPAVGQALPRQHLARIAYDGSVDAFAPKPDSHVLAIAVAATGEIIIGGKFRSVAAFNVSTPVVSLARLSPAGAVDPRFKPNAGQWVHAISVQRDGRVLVGRDFREFRPDNASRVARNFVARLNPCSTPGV